MANSHGRKKQIIPPKSTCWLSS